MYIISSSRGGSPFGRTDVAISLRKTSFIQGDRHVSPADAGLPRDDDVLFYIIAGFIPIHPVGFLIDIVRCKGPLKNQFSLVSQQYFFQQMKI